MVESIELCLSLEQQCFQHLPNWLQGCNVPVYVCLQVHECYNKLTSIFTAPATVNTVGVA